MRARNFVFTVNFPTKLPVYALDTSKFPQWISYACWQQEIGENGNRHLQGYVECIGKRSLRQLLTIPGFDTQAKGYSIRFDVRRGTQQQAIQYCSKVDDTTVPDTFVEYGEKKEQGKRSDLDEIKEKMDLGTSLKRISDEHFGSFIRYHRSFKVYKRINARSRTSRTMILVLWGPSGCGKSRLARECFPDAFWKTNNKWWDDYEGDEAVVWDEFKGQYPYRDLLRILDSTPLTVEVKGCSSQFNSKVVVFTSNFHPKDWYDPAVIGMSWENSPLRRRLAEYGQICYMGPRPVLGLIPGPIPVLGNSANFVPAPL